MDGNAKSSSAWQHFLGTWKSPIWQSKAAADIQTIIGALDSVNNLMTFMWHVRATLEPYINGFKLSLWQRLKKSTHFNLIMIFEFILLGYFNVIQDQLLPFIKKIGSFDVIYVKSKEKNPW